MLAKMLSERSDANRGSADRDGRTPVPWAAAKGYGKIVGMLSQQNDVHPSVVDESGQTPFP